MHWIEDSEFIALDLETTGLDPRRSCPVSAALTLHNGPHAEPLPGVPALIRPDVPITPGAQRVHGITADVLDQMTVPPVAAALPMILGVLAQAADRGVMVVGANVHYDLHVLLYSAHRVGLEGAGATLRRLRVGDPLLLDRAWDQVREGGRSLVRVCEHYGVAHASPHVALGDATATGRLFHRLLHLTTLDDDDLGHLATHPVSRGRLEQLRGAGDPGALHEVHRRFWAAERGPYLRRRRARGDLHYVPEADWPVEAYAAPADSGVEYASEWVRARGGKALGGGALAEELAVAFERGRQAALAQIGQDGD